MTSQESGTKAIIIGAGIAGPVLATFLKRGGYHVVLYERSEGLADIGVGHWCVRFYNQEHTHRTFDNTAIVQFAT